MKKLAILLLLPVLAVLLAMLTASSTGSAAAEQAGVGDGSGVQFGYVDILLDPHSQPLAAYQVSLVLTTPGAMIVGIEGGDHAAFNAAPYYDPAALQNQRIIVAAYSLNGAKDLPMGKTRVARLHLQLPAHAAPRFTTELTVAATTNGAAISDAAISLQPGENP